MNKWVVGVIIAIIIIIAAVIGVTLYKNNNADINNSNAEENVGNNVKEEKKTGDNKDGINTEDKKTSTENKILVVYFSAQNHTKTVAEKIAKNLDADIFEIVPEEVYTADDLNWNDSNSRVSKEHENESLRDVKLKNTKVDNWEEYDTVLIGYPIWWGIAAWPVDTFVRENNFDGKTVIPFCTSSSSGLGQSGNLLQEEANSGKWLSGQRFSSSASDSEIKKWTDNLNKE